MPESTATNAVSYTTPVGTIREIATDRFEGAFGGLVSEVVA
ncbi:MULTISPECIES: hypothetical protein [unclassified Mesorhizobium]|nr:MULTISPECIES: hypothetical protein [unclassified Mesorhizobium]